MLSYACKGLNIIGAIITGYVVLKTVYEMGVEDGRKEAAESISQKTEVTDKFSVSDILNNLKKGHAYEIDKNGAKVRLQVL